MYRGTIAGTAFLRSRESSTGNIYKRDTMYTIERDLLGFPEIYRDGRRMLQMINNPDQSKEADAADLQEVLTDLNHREAMART